MKKYSFIKGFLPFDGLDFIGTHTSLSEERALELFLPKEVLIPLLQHRGNPAELLVKEGDYVRIGQPIGKVKDAPSAPVHASISGTVTSIEQLRLPDGRVSSAVRIESDGKRQYISSVKKNENFLDFTPKILWQLLFQSGIVGMGGEGYSAFYKCQIAEEFGVDTLLINGIQCEPYLTCDSYQLRERSSKVIQGAAALAGVLQIKKIRFCIQDKWMREIEAMYTALQGVETEFLDKEMEILLFRSRYPQGYEKLLCQAVYEKPFDLNKTVEEQYKAVVFNVSTCCAFAEMLEKNLPCVSRIITLSGDQMDKKNIQVPIGTRVSELLAAVPEAKDANIVLGGAITGVPISDLDMPVMKTTTGITVLQNEIPKPMHCIRCGSCESACPMNLIPHLCERLILGNKEKKLEKLPIEQCISCGACSYVCPSKHSLSYHIARYAHQARMKKMEGEKEA